MLGLATKDDWFFGLHFDVFALFTVEQMVFLSVMRGRGGAQHARESSEYRLKRVQEHHLSK